MRLCLKLGFKNRDHGCELSLMFKDNLKGKFSCEISNVNFNYKYERRYFTYR